MLLESGIWAHHTTPSPPKPKTDRLSLALVCYPSRLVLLPPPLSPPPSRLVPPLPLLRYCTVQVCFDCRYHYRYSKLHVD